MIIAIIIITTKDTHTQMHKMIKRRKSKGNRIEDRQRMKVEECK